MFYTAPLGWLACSAVDQLVARRGPIHGGGAPISAGELARRASPAARRFESRARRAPENRSLALSPRARSRAGARPRAPARARRSTGTRCRGRFPSPSGSPSGMTQAPRLARLSLSPSLSLSGGSTSPRPLHARVLKRFVPAENSPARAVDGGEHRQAARRARVTRAAGVWAHRVAPRIPHPFWCCRAPGRRPSPPPQRPPPRAHTTTPSFERRGPSSSFGSSPPSRAQARAAPRARRARVRHVACLCGAAPRASSSRVTGPTAPLQMGQRFWWRVSHGSTHDLWKPWSHSRKRTCAEERREGQRAFELHPRRRAPHAARPRARGEARAVSPTQKSWKQIAHSALFRKR